MVYTVRTCSYTGGPLLLLLPPLIKNKTEAPKYLGLFLFDAVMRRNSH